MPVYFMLSCNTEYGHVMPKSVDQFDKKVDEYINSLEGDAVQLVIDMLRDTVKSIRDDQDRIKTLQREISRLASQTKNAKHFLTVPGIGDIIMAYMCVLLADPTQFSLGRQFAAYLGLVPMHTGSGGKTVTTKIPGRCDKALRALLVQGAHAVARLKCRTDWVKNILAKKPRKVAMVAIANLSSDNRMDPQIFGGQFKGRLTSGGQRNSHFSYKSRMSFWCSDRNLPLELFRPKVGDGSSLTHLLMALREISSILATSLIGRCSTSIRRRIFALSSGLIMVFDPPLLNTTESMIFFFLGM